MPSEQELRNYFVKLPEIYKTILEAFPHAVPARQTGYSLTVPSIQSDVKERGKEYSLAQVFRAAEELERNGIVELKHNMFVRPTDYGERLIAVGTGHECEPVFVEPLPLPPR